MDEINEDDFNKAKGLAELNEKEKIKALQESSNNVLNPEEIKSIVKDLDQPVETQKELAAKIKIFLDNRMEQEMREKNSLSHFTRLWVREYNDLLDRIHKNLHGEKSVSLNLHKITHAHIASVIRRSDDMGELDDVKLDSE